MQTRRHALGTATLAFVGYVIGCAAFVAVYDLLFGGVLHGLLGIANLGAVQVHVDYPGGGEAIGYSLMVLAAAGFLYGFPVLLWSAVAWGLIVLDPHPVPAVRQATRIYVMVYGANLLVMAGAMALLS